MRPGSLDVAEIAALHLFGEASDTPAESLAGNYTAPETRLQLELLGVFQSEAGDTSAAIVAERNKPGILYQVGDKMPGNAVLTEVFVDRIVLRRGSVYETLRFSEESALLASNEAASPEDSRVQNASFGQRQPLGTPTTGRDARNGTATTSRGSIREFVTGYRQQLQEDPDKALASIGLTPVAAGQSKGYKLGNLANSPQLRSTGLQPNDVILSVNGQPVGDVQQDQMQLDNVLSQGTARLEVQRGQRRFYVTAKL